MSRALIILTAALGIAVSGTPALAQTPPPEQCPAQIQAGAAAALPGSRLIDCRREKSDTRKIDGQVLAGTILGFHARVALADGRIVMLELSPDGKVVGMTDGHGDLVGSSGKGTALLFWAFALASVVGALFVVTRRNLIAAVMGMVGSFLGISAIYMMLYAQFLAVIQMLVYAGAIMVLFVFVVMILNRPEDEPVAPTGRVGQVLGGVAILYLVGRLVLILVQVEPPNPVVAMAAPLATAEGYDWGSLRAVGTNLFGPGLFPFEAISIMLLIAVVGAIAIARPLHAEDDAPAKVRSGGRVP
ncbi:MAG TPA: NADH-quinone oxidoreductase subunit J [Kofleriaceae bacterium]|jgi:NADH-quinone oxidoreductase subunit J|nr:NADH-quinone oxidoreductase subunit J [Kofleriaceae bacterium]